MGPPNPQWTINDPPAPDFIAQPPPWYSGTQCQILTYPYYTTGDPYRAIVEYQAQFSTDGGSNWQGPDGTANTFFTNNAFVIIFSSGTYMVRWRAKGFNGNISAWVNGINNTYAPPNPPFAGCRLFNSASQLINNGTAPSLTFDSETYDSNNLHFTSVANLTGTVSKTATNATITGSGTSFTTELSVNQVFDIPGGGGNDRVVVASIASNTSLTVVTAPTHTASGQTATRVNSTIAIPSGYAGKWRFYGNVLWAANATGQRNIWFQKNGGTTVGANVVPGATAAFGVNQNFSMEINMTVGDYMELQVFQDSGANINVVRGADYSVIFGCSYLGA